MAKECSMIPLNVNMAVITATPSTDLGKAEIKIESPLGGHVLNASTFVILFIIVYRLVFNGPVVVIVDR